ncbi:MAG: HAD family hydrolase [Ignavibacteria bacterium]
MIRNIIFDLGNVLVGVDFDKFKNEILSAGISERTFNRLLPLREKFESGLISTNEFLSSVTEKLDHKISKKRFLNLYKEIFTEIPQMKEFLISLSRTGNYKLILLSNTNPLHFSLIKKKFEYLKLLNIFALSYRLKMIKPDIRIYKKVLRQYQLTPAETLFIDDLIENCITAEKLGIETIHFKHYQSFIERFNKIIKNETMYTMNY